MRTVKAWLATVLAAFVLVGCDPSVGGGEAVFVNEADLRGTVSAPATGIPGTNVSWTFLVDNDGPQPVADVPVSALLSLGGVQGAGLLGEDVYSWTCTATAGSCADASGRGPLETTVSLANGGRATFTLRAPVGFSAPAGQDITASLEVGADTRWPDPSLANNVASGATTIGAAPVLADFSDEIIYWALTDRFANGDPSNDDGLGDRRGDEADPSDPIGWHGGDFAGIRQKIETGYFQGMGFTAIWISPVVLQVPALSNGNAAYHGYWPEDWQLMEPHFGTMADLAAMTAAARAADLKVVMDVVVNHVGFDAQLITQRPDWVRTGAECGTDDETLCLAGLPDMVQENPEVEAYLLSVLDDLLVGSGVDAIRWDAMKHVNRDFWTAVFAPDAPANRSQLWSVGEVFDSSPERIAYYLDDVGSPSVFDFPLWVALNESLTGLGFTSRLADVLAADGVYSDPGRLSTFLDNHDVPRWISRSIEDAGRPRAEALERLDMALTFLYANRGIPVVYYGTEIGMEGLGDPFSFRDGNSNRESMDFAAAGDPAIRVCGITDQGLDNAEAFGAEFFVRGGFNDWGDPASALLVNLGDGEYAAAFEISAGDYEFKLASADWSSERTRGDDVVLGEPFPLDPGGDNARISLAQDGCYQFTVDTAESTVNPVLTVTRLNTAAPLVRRLAELAEARQDYAALRHGSQNVLYDFGQQCRIAGEAPPDPFGGQLFMRGGFNDWGATPEAAFLRTGETTYEAEFVVPAGDYGYKIAVEDWSFERVTEPGTDTVPGGGVLALVPGGGQPNGNLVVTDAGCYNFRVEAADVDAMTLQVTEGDDADCGVQPADPDEIAFGRRMFVRGSFSDWADPPSASDAFSATGLNRLEALVALPAGEHAYKIASADWSVERAVIGLPTLLDMPQLIGIPAGNGSIEIATAGCYRWTMDTADPEVVTLIVSGEPAGGDVFALRRDLEGSPSVILVLNNGDNPADLGTLGGIEASGMLDGPAIELSGRAQDLAFAGGRLLGSVPPRTAFIVSDR